MFILETIFAFVVSFLIYIICEATGNKHLAQLTKLAGGLICIQFLLSAMVPFFHTAGEKIERVADRVYSMEKKIDRYSDAVDHYQDKVHKIENRGNSIINFGRVKGPLYDGEKER